MAPLNRAVFLDRDGTLIVRRSEYLTDPADVELLPGAAEAVRHMRAAGFRVLVATNQSAVARGLMTEAALGRVHDRMRALLEAEGAPLDGIYACPHLPDGAVETYRAVCECRKPKPGMLLRAAQERGLDLPRSFMIGDALRDLATGRAAGARTVLVLTGTGGVANGDGRVAQLADHVAADLRAAVDFLR